MQQININTTVDQDNCLYLKMPQNLAGMLIKGTLLYQQIEPVSLPDIKKKKIDINAVRQICDDIRNLPIIDSKTADEIIGYNELGILE